MEAKDITFVTVLYNDLSHVKNLLSSIVDHKKKGVFSNAKIALVIVDNSETLEYFSNLKVFLDVLSSFKDEVNDRGALGVCYRYGIDGVSVLLVKSKKNNGFSYGNNVGIRVSRNIWLSQVYWLINNDCAVTESVSNIVGTILSGKNFFYGVKVVYASQPDIIQGIGGVYDSDRGRVNVVGQGAAKDNYTGLVRDIDYPNGASMIISSDVVDRVGLLSEDFFLYFEELDYAIRARAQGVDVGVLCDCEILHVVGGSIGTSPSIRKRSALSEFHINKSRITIAKKYFAKSHYRWHTVIRAVKLILIFRFILAVKVAKLVVGRG